MTFNYTATYGGGEGPDVWDRLIELSAVDIEDAVKQAIARAEHDGGWVFSVDQNDFGPKWSKDTPNQSGIWWWWNEDEDSAPIPVSIAYSGTDGTYFAMAGQYGWTRFQPVTEMGGCWMRCTEPFQPTHLLK